MKNKIIATLVAFGLVGSASAIEINDNLSINGFIDGSYNKTDAALTANDSESLGLDEIEVNFLLNVGSVSGAIHVDTEGGTDSVDIEQAHFTYSLDNGVSFTLGRYGRALGLEREDPAGLYTFSRAYDINGANYGGSDYNFGNVDASSVEGLTVAYAAENFSVGISFEEAAGANLNTADLNTEIAISYTGIENLVLNGGYFIDNGTAGAERDVFGLNATYTAGKALIGAEYISASDDVATNGEDAFLILVDYDFSDKLGGAIRYSEWEESSTNEYSKLTIAPNYALTDSLGAILEYSDVDTGSDNADYDYLALELTYTF